MGNVTSSIYGAFFLLLAKISEKLNNKNTQENMNLQHNNKENLLDGNTSNSYKNVDIEKNNKADNINKNSNKHFNFFGKNNVNEKENKDNSMKYQLLKNSEYDFETNDLNKKEEIQNYEILKQEIKQSHIEFDEEMNLNNENNLKDENDNTGMFFKDNCQNEHLISANNEIIENNNDKAEKNKQATKNHNKSYDKTFNKPTQIVSDDKESFEDLRKQILENKFDEED